VVALIAEGLHNRAIAQQLGITENTVRHHLTAVYGKLGVADRLELAVHALRQRAAGRGRK
jgi:DNA-binding NarL/FixJ family response regulator